MTETDLAQVVKELHRSVSQLAEVVAGIHANTEVLQTRLSQLEDRSLKGYGAHQRLLDTLVEQTGKMTTTIVTLNKRIDLVDDIASKRLDVLEDETPTGT